MWPCGPMRTDSRGADRVALMLAHVDVNSAYASFERVLNPRLEGRPLVPACVRLNTVHTHRTHLLRRILKAFRKPGPSSHPEFDNALAATGGGSGSYALSDSADGTR